MGDDDDQIGNDQNLEGIGVGPRLPNGSSILLGVVDNGDPISSNTIVSFELAPLSPIANDPDTGDFDQDAHGQPVLAAPGPACLYRSLRPGAS